VVGTEEGYSGLDQDPWMKISTLLFNDASNEELLLLVKAVVRFCNKKKILIGKGR